MKEIKISKSQYPRGEDGHKNTTIRLPIALLDQLEDIAIKTNRSRNEVVVMLLSAALENVTIEE